MKNLFLLFCLLNLFFQSCVNDSESSLTDSVGNEQSEVTDPRICKDASGKVYKTIVIGQQRWLAENYAYLPTVFPTEDSSVSESRSYVYSYTGSDVSIAKLEYNYGRYGVLYNYKGAVDYCPKGWHLPSDDEWKELELYLGMTDKQVNMLGIIDEANNTRGSTDILKKFLSISYGGTNESGFNILFAGACDDKGFSFIMKAANYWTSSIDKNDSNKAYFRGFALMPGVYRGPNYMKTGMSVRYIKD